MPQRIRSPLERRSNRLKLPISPKPIFVTIGPGINLGYRRCAGPGRWIVRCADGAGSSWQRAFASADDHEPANGSTVLDYVQATDKARLLARGQDAEGGKPGTVREALDDYASDLQARGGRAGNVQRLRFHLPATLLSRPVALLASRELRQWRDSLLDRMKPATANRTALVLKAALNAAAQHDEKLANVSAWRLGLATLPGATTARNVILSDDEVRRVVAAAYTEGVAFGLLVETAAQTGARVSQLARLIVGDLQDGRADPRLLVPRSAKGRSGQRKAAERRPVPIGAALAAKLRQAAGNDPHAPLLTKADGSPWRTEPAEHRHPFARAVARCGLDPAEVTIYALRHSAITRALLAGTPVRVVASNCDTSTAIIERVYARFISDHADTVARRGLLDLEAPAANVIPIPRAG